MFANYHFITGGVAARRQAAPQAPTVSAQNAPIPSAPPLAPVLAQVEEAPAVVTYDLSYESVFYQHYFDTGIEKEKTFAPVYQYAYSNIYYFVFPHIAT